MLNKGRKNMFRKFLSFILISAAFQMICTTSVSAAVGQADKETERIAKIKERVNAAHLGKKTVVVTRRGAAKLKGYVSEVNEFSFVVRSEQSGTPSEVRFDDVTQVKSKGSGLSSGTKILIGAGIAAAVILVLIVKPLGGSPFPKCNADQSNAPCDNRR